MTIQYDYRALLLAATAAAIALVLGAPAWHAAISAAAVLAFGVSAVTLLTPRALPITPTSPEVIPQIPSRRGAVHPLTPTQTKVAALVAQGLTNHEIADILVVDERTIDNHVAAIFDRLDFHRRSQVAVWAVEHGLHKPDVSTPK